MNGTCQLQKLITFETYVRFLYNMIMITGPLKGKSNYHMIVALVGKSNYHMIVATVSSDIT
jgi:hypothetical protein